MILVGDNYYGDWNQSRTACRAIVIIEGKILLSFETKTDQWMLPGGGVENDESEADCCIREVEEETGVVIQPSECLLEIDEYYENCKWVNKYYVCTAIGEGQRNLTAREQRLGMEPRWLPIDEILSIFSSMHLMRTRTRCAEACISESIRRFVNCFERNESPIYNAKNSRKETGFLFSAVFSWTKTSLYKGYQKQSLMD